MTLWYWHLPRGLPVTLSVQTPHHASWETLEQLHELHLDMRTEGQKDRYMMKGWHRWTVCVLVFWTNGAVEGVVYRHKCNNRHTNRNQYTHEHSFLFLYILWDYFWKIIPNPFVKFQQIKIFFRSDSWLQNPVYLQQNSSCMKQHLMNINTKLPFQK